MRFFLIEWYNITFNSKELIGHTEYPVLQPGIALINIVIARFYCNLVYIKCSLRSQCECHKGI